MKRISFEDMAMQIAIVASKRSEDPHKKVGACVLDKNGRVLGVGYNGLRAGQIEDETFWNDRDIRRNYIIHAEVNALSNVDVKKANILAVTLLPCSSCANIIASTNISKVIYGEEYEKDENSKKIFKFHNIDLQKYESDN
jgi:dCMP deaminase